MNAPGTDILVLARAVENCCRVSRPVSYGSTRATRDHFDIYRLASYRVAPRLAELMTTLLPPETEILGGLGTRRSADHCGALPGDRAARRPGADRRRPYGSASASSRARFTGRFVVLVDDAVPSAYQASQQRRGAAAARGHGHDGGVRHRPAGRAAGCGSGPRGAGRVDPLRTGAGPHTVLIVRIAEAAAATSASTTACTTGRDRDCSGYRPETPAQPGGLQRPGPTGASRRHGHPRQDGDAVTCRDSPHQEEHVVGLPPDARLEAFGAAGRPDGEPARGVLRRHHPVPIRERRQRPVRAASSAVTSTSGSAHKSVATNCRAARAAHSRTRRRPRGRRRRGRAVRGCAPARPRSPRGPRPGCPA